MPETYRGVEQYPLAGVSMRYSIDADPDGPTREQTIYSPDTTAVPEGVAANLRGRSCKILANVEVGEDCSGVLFAHGSRFGGH